MSKGPDTLGRVLGTHADQTSTTSTTSTDPLELYAQTEATHGTRPVVTPPTTNGPDAYQLTEVQTLRWVELREVIQIEAGIKKAMNHEANRTDVVKLGTSQRQP